MTAPAPAPGALVLFSGGQDSAVCLAWALQRHARVETVGFDYGQRHAVEMTARLQVRERMTEVEPRWADRLGPDHIIDLTSFGAVAKSALTAGGGFGLRPDGLPAAFVPGRNLAFFIYAAALADQRGLDKLVGGMCETDFSGYPDCRRDTLEALERAINLGMAADFVIETPLMSLDKADTWDLARQLGGETLVEMILEHSHTCYQGVRDVRHDWGYGCGACPACDLRRSGWRRYLASVAA